MPSRLPWGNVYLLVDPAHFDVVYKINPYMDPDLAVDKALARTQWEHLRAAMEEAGAEVHVLMPPPAECPDMVFAMNLGYAGMNGAGERRVLMSRMRHFERQSEAVSARAWFTEHGFEVRELPDDPSLYLEAGDQFPWGDIIVSGTGPRTAPEALHHLANSTGMPVLPLATVSDHAYHLDLSFCPLTPEAAIVYPPAFTEESSEALLARIPNPIVLTEEEALSHFSANSIVVRDTVIMPGRTSPRVVAAVEALGLKVVLVDVSEFEKGGGSVRCMTNPLDFPL